MHVPLDFPPATWQSFNGYISLSLEGATGFIREPGAPMMPFWGTTLVFPVNSRILGVGVENATYQEHLISGKIVPAPEPISLLSSEATSLFEGPAYSRNALFPAGVTDFSETTGASDSGCIEAHLMVKVFPLRYNPVTGQLQELKRATLGVRYETSRAPVPVGNQSYDILVLTPPEFQSQMQRYVNFKEGLGYAVKMENLTQVYGGSVFNVSAGRDNQEKIKLFIKQALENWTVKFVVLTGDTDKFPIRRAYINDIDGQQTPTDLYYGDIYKAGTTTFSDWDKNKNNVFGESGAGNANSDSVDLDPDVSVGRYPAGTEPELSAMINKSISYAENVTTGGWFQNVTLVGTDTFSASYGDSSGVAEGEYACDQAFTSLSLFCATKYYEKKGTFDSAKIRAGLNRGEGFALFSNHGNVDGVCYPSSGGGPGLYSSMATALSNGPKLPLSILDACLTHAVDYSECLGEYLVLNPGGGSINSIGATRIGYGMFGIWHTYANSGYMLVHLTEQFNKGTATPSQMLDKTKRSYLSNIGIWDYADFKTLVEYITLGDPATILGGQGIMPVPDNATKWADPGKGATYTVTVANTAMHPDDLQLSVIGSRWNCTLDNTKLHLAANSSATVTVQVLVDPLAGALERDNATLTILSKSTGLPVKLNLTTGANIVRRVNFSLATFSMSANPGDNLTLNCTIINDGNILETARVSVLGGQGIWQPRLVLGDYPVPPRSRLQPAVGFQVPEKTLCGTYDLRIEMATDSGLAKVAGLKVDVLKTYGFRVWTANDRDYCGPGGAKFDITFENLGNHDDFCRIDALNVPDAWTIGCPSSIDLGAFGVREAIISLEADGHALAGDYVVPVAITSSTGVLVDTLNLTATVNRTSSLRFLCPENTRAANQGSDVVYHVKVVSQSNFYEHLDLQVQRLPEGWTWFQASEPLIVPPFTSSMADIALEVPDPCQAGWYSLDVIASTPQWRGLAGLSVQVKEERAFTALLDREQAVLRPGEQSVFGLVLTNNGNCRDSYLLDSTGLFSVDIPRNMIGLEPRTSETASIIVTAPASVRSGIYDIDLKVSSMADRTHQKAFKVHVRIEKISNMVVEFDSRSEVMGGSTGAFWVTATNLGSEEETLDLSGLDLPPWNIGYQPVAVPPGATRQIPVTFTLPEGLAGGSYNLSFRAHTDAQSWPVTHKVDVPLPSVQPASSGSSGQGRSLLPFIAVAAAAVLFLGIVALARKGRRKKQQASGQSATAQAGSPPVLPPQESADARTLPAPYSPSMAGTAPVDSDIPLPPPPPWYSPPNQ
jgi:uncharacterized membrane protein